MPGPGPQRRPPCARAAGRLEVVAAILLTLSLADDATGDLAELTLEDAARGKSVHEPPVAVTHPRTGELAGCHIVFVARSEQATVLRPLTGIERAGVLNVGETDGFTRAGGMIGMRIQDQKVRFDVNLDAAQRAGLRGVSQLPRLATQVLQ